MSSASTILIADDDRAIRTVLHQALGRQGHNVRSTGAAATLWQWVQEGEGQLVITDVVMPDENGLDLVPRIRKLRPDLRIIVMSAQSTLLTAVRATERGAFEYLPKPFDLNELISVVNRALSAPATSMQRNANPQEEGERLPLIGRSPAMQEIYRALARLMSTDLTVMVTGESGAGKELVARALHDYGKRRKGPFVALNMAAIPRELIESELFGHERGAFTGAVQRSAGKFEQASGGTLFLDEIGDMPPEAQTRLLRVLQEGEYMTVGGRTPIKANVRIVAATHRDLRRLIQQGLFREDLFYRLNVVPIRLPPLARAARRHPRTGQPLSAGGDRRRASVQGAVAGRHGAAEAAPLAGQRPRAGQPRAPPVGALFGGSDRRRDHRGRAGRRGFRHRAGAPGAAMPPAAISRWPTPSTGTCRRFLSPMASACRRTACTIVSFPRSSARCCPWRWAQRAGISCALPVSWGSIAIRCARR